MNEGKTYTIHYESRNDVQSGPLELTTPYLTRPAAVDFLAAIGTQRLIGVFENDLPLSSARTSDFVLEADLLGIDLRNNIPVHQRMALLPLTDIRMAANRSSTANAE